MSSWCREHSVGLRIRGCLGSILTRGNILPLDFFHVVKPLMPILPLLPILSICEKPDLMKSEILSETVQIKMCQGTMVFIVTQTSRRILLNRSQFYLLGIYICTGVIGALVLGLVLSVIVFRRLGYRCKKVGSNFKPSKSFYYY